MASPQFLPPPPPPCVVESARDFLNGRINYERNPRGLKRVTLERMQRLAKALGNPQKRLPIVHVAGTKGKGSTCTMLAEILRCAGLRVGLLTSPHLHRVEERIAVDGVPIATDQLTSLIQEIRPVVERIDQLDTTQRGPTFFDILTAAGFLHFARVPVDIAVIEVGLGGRLDSTNICTPLCSVITSISRDHMKQLGDTEALIAREKAGIIKRHVPVVSGVTHQDALAVIREVARREEAPLIELNRDFFADLSADSSSRDLTDVVAGQVRRGPTFDFRYLDAQAQHHIVPAIQLAMMGDHQAHNAALALATVAVLKPRFAIEDMAVRAGLAAAQLPARLELLHHEPTVILDGAHNEASILALCDTLDQKWPDRHKRFVFGTTRGKDIRSMLGRVLRSAHEIVLTRYVANPRGADPVTMAKLVETLPKTSCRIQTVTDPVQAWQATLRQASSHELICVTGSLFLAAELRERMVGDLSQHPALVRV